MGLRFRKSINLGKHFRINLSSKGIGYSYGTKGYRHTVSADGKERITTSIPGTGLSNVETVTNKKRKRSSGIKLLPFILAAALIMCLMVYYWVYESYNSPRIPPKNESSENIGSSALNTDNQYFDFSDTMTFFVTEGKTEYINCQLKDVSSDDVVISNENSDIAAISVSNTVNDVMTIAIQGISPGNAFFTLQSSDGEKVSDKLCIVVEELYPHKTTIGADNGLYIINTSSGIFHLPDCSYLPDSDNSKTVFSRDEALSEGCVPCSHCNP